MTEALIKLDRHPDNGGPSPQSQLLQSEARNRID